MHPIVQFSSAVSLFAVHSSIQQQRNSSFLRRIAVKAVYQAAQVMDNPADLITETQDNAKMASQVRDVVEREGGATALLEQCELVRAHQSNRYQPFVKRFYSSHRRVLFRVLKTLDIRSTTQNQSLIAAMTFILDHE